MPNSSQKIQFTEYHNMQKYKDSMHVHIRPSTAKILNQGLGLQPPNKVVITKANNITPKTWKKKKKTQQNTSEFQEPRK